MSSKKKSLHENAILKFSYGLVLKFRVVMTWSDDKDLAPLVDVASINLFSYKKGLKERGKCWIEVADLLVKQGFKVDQRAVRDHYTTLQNKNNSEERKASGIAPELTPTQAEITNILEDLAQQVEDSENCRGGTGPRFLNYKE